MPQSCCIHSYLGKCRDSEIAPTEMLSVVGGNSDSRRLWRFTIKSRHANCVDGKFVGMARKIPRHVLF